MLRYVIAGVFGLASQAMGQGCIGDCNGDGDFTVLDFVCYQGDFAAGLPGADCNGDGSLNVLDFICFQDAWETGCAEPGTFPDMWLDGDPDCATANEPLVQVHWYNDDLVIIREGPCANFEAPFLYGIFGDDMVVFLDTGAVSRNVLALDEVFQSVVDEWLARNPDIQRLEQVVAHTHQHGDHVQGDPLFSNNPDWTFISASLAASQAFWGVDPAKWPDDIVEFDLGNRVLDIIPMPGHQMALYSFYDRRTRLLITADHVYPGRLFVFDTICDFRESLERLWGFIQNKPVAHVVGCHIEMSNTPGEQFAIGSTWHPDEHPLQLTKDHVKQVLDASIAVGNTPFPPTQHIFDEFIIHVFAFSNCP